MSVKKDDIFDIDIVAMGSDGTGYGRHEGFIIFVPFTLCGENVKVRINHVKRDNIAFAALIKINKPSDDRVKPLCKVFGRCGGCSLQHMSYEAQLNFKALNVKNILKKIGGIDIPAAKIIESEPYEYRNKLQLPVGRKHSNPDVTNSQEYAKKNFKVINGNQEFVIGFYESGSHNIVPTSECRLNGEFAEKVIRIIKRYIDATKILPYSETTHDGLLRHVVARYFGDGITLTLVINGESIPGVNLLNTLAAEAFADYSLFLNINRQKSNVILGDKSIYLGGKKTRTVTIDGIVFNVNQNSFMQVNNGIRDKLYAEAISAIKEMKPDLVIEAYSGISIMGCLIAKSGVPVFAFESVPEAVNDANLTAEKHSLPLLSIEGDIATTLPRFVKALHSDSPVECLKKYSANVSCNRISDLLDRINFSGDLRIAVLTDPSRKGCAPEFLDCLIKLKPRDILYISCNPATLARDLKILINNAGAPYALWRQPVLFDMFPQTVHTETLACLKLKP